MKKFNLNGVNVELSKKQLRDMLKEYDEPVGEIKLSEENHISLYKNGSFKCFMLWGNLENNSLNLSTVSRDMAEVMGDLMETSCALDKTRAGFNVYYNTGAGAGYQDAPYNNSSAKHFNSEMTASLAAKLLNESQDMKDGIKRMSK